MNIWEIDKLFLFLIFFIPGFISLKVYTLLIPSGRKDFSKSLFEIIGYSSLNFAALWWLIIIIHSGIFYNEYKVLYFLALIFIFFIMPVLWPFILLKISSWGPIARRILNPIPTPWDYVFNKRESYWVIAHLKNGKKIGGIFGKNSFASSYPDEEQIYLEEVWQLNDQNGFEAKIERSNGIIIFRDEVLALEFFK